MTALAAVVLAAGRGERFGGPKALVAWPSGDSELPLAAVHVSAWPQAQRVLVVTRREMAQVLARHAPTLFGRAGRGVLVVSDAPDSQGPAGSLAAAARWLLEAPTAWDAVVVSPVDCPPVAAGTAAELLAALADPEVMASRPRHRSRGGHPVVLRAGLLERYLEPDPAPLRDLLRALGPACREIVTDDPSVLADVDTPAQWRAHTAAAAAATPRFFA